MKKEMPLADVHSASVELSHDDEAMESVAGNVFEYFQSLDYLRNIVSRRKYFAQMSAEDMFSHVRGVRSMVGSGDIGYEHSLDGDGVMTGSLQPPHHEDKPKLLMYAWQKVVEGILCNDRYTDEQALTYAGLAIGGAITIVHLFGDGNGRTARIVAAEVMHGAGLSRERLAEIVTGGEKSLYIRPPQDFAVRHMPFKLNDPDGIILNGMRRYLSDADLEMAFIFQGETPREDLVASSHQGFDIEETQRRDAYREFLAAGFMAWVDTLSENPRVSLNNELTEEFFKKRINRLRVSLQRIKEEVKTCPLPQQPWHSQRIRLKEEALRRDKRNLAYMNSHYGAGEGVPYLEQWRLRSYVLSGNMIE